MTPEDTRHDGLVTAVLPPLCRPAARHVPEAELDYLGDLRHRLRVRTVPGRRRVPLPYSTELVTSKSVQSLVFKRGQRNTRKQGAVATWTRTTDGSTALARVAGP